INDGDSARRGRIRTGDLRYPAAFDRGEECAVLAKCDPVDRDRGVHGDCAWPTCEVRNAIEGWDQESARDEQISTQGVCRQPRDRAGDGGDGPLEWRSVRLERFLGPTPLSH